ncbi:GyrI-like domain-containing protein [Planctomicrobium sp. SH661]|uniref:GyrI-like domain-containing protein n=1 Tax=Planctomicrobium sp. SH661 TaxID=3448124 RepID=UPI003F5BAD24
MNSPSIALAAPRFEDGNHMLLAGLNGRFNEQTRHEIGSLWWKFAPYIGKVPNQTGGSAYGVCWRTHPDCSFDYLCGVEITTDEGLPADFITVDLKPQRYAVFTHSEHAQRLPETFEAIYQRWLPQSGFQPAAAPVFERYTEEYNPETGMGGTEVWLPLQA